MMQTMRRDPIFHVTTPSIARGRILGKRPEAREFGLILS